MAFLDGYNTYDTSEGYGNPEQWKDAFNARMGYNKAKTVLEEDDPYTILGITKSATNNQIKKAYRVLAMKWHPDKNLEEDTKEKFQKILAAYTVIKKERNIK
jgi:DnaJ-class molecular chaperone